MPIGAFSVPIGIFHLEGKVMVAAKTKTKTFNLASYKDKADAEYGVYSIRVSEDTVVKLLNPLRIAEEKQDRLFALIPSLSTPEGEEPDANSAARIIPAMLEILELVGDENVGKLINAIRGDFAVVMSIFQDYFKEIGLGEVSLSEK
jgi:hypothetical protein